MSAAKVTKFGEYKYEQRKKGIRKQCEAFTQRGTLCKKKALHNSTCCHVHQGSLNEQEWKTIRESEVSLPHVLERRKGSRKLKTNIEEEEEDESSEEEDRYKGTVKKLGQEIRHAHKKDVRAKEKQKEVHAEAKKWRYLTENEEEEEEDEEPKLAIQSGETPTEAWVRRTTKELRKKPKVKRKKPVVLKTTSH